MKPPRLFTVMVTTECVDGQTLDWELTELQAIDWLRRMFVNLQADDDCALLATKLIFVLCRKEVR